MSDESIASPVTLGAAYLRRIGSRRELEYVSAVDTDRACLVKAYTPAPYLPQAEILGFPTLANMLANGVLIPTRMGRNADGKVIAVDLARLPHGSLSAAESVEVFYVSGPGVHNRNSAHMIVGFVGECCSETRVHLHLSAQATVIASTPQAAPTRFNIVMGDVIVVNRRPYRVCAVMHADPILVPVSYDAA